MRTHVTDTPSGAESVQQLAVLLEAGIAPTRAWQLLAEAGDPVAADVASEIGTGREKIRPQQVAGVVRAAA